MLEAPLATRAANRFDAVASTSAVAPGSAATITLAPNGTWPSSGTITFASTGSGSFSPPSVRLAGGSSAKTVQYTPSGAGEHKISFTAPSGLFVPYPVPLNCWTSASGTAQTLSATLVQADMGGHQFDRVGAKPTGFAGQSWVNCWGEVPINVSAIGGATRALYARFYDADSSGATTTAGTGTALHTSAVQVYGAISAPGTITPLLPGGALYTYMDLATDAAFTNPIRVPQRFCVGLGMGVLSRSQEAGICRQFAYSDAAQLTGVNYTKVTTLYSSDRRCGAGGDHWFCNDGVSTDTNPNHDAGSTAGAQEFGRLVAAKLGVLVFMCGAADSAGGTDSFIRPDGTLSGGFADTIGAIRSKFRWLWSSLGGWDTVDSTYPETYDNYVARYNALASKVPALYPACALIGFCAAASGFFGQDGSRDLGYTRLGEACGEIEAVNPMFFRRDNYAWNHFAPEGHSSMSARTEFARTGFMHFLSHELTIAGGLQVETFGPRLAKAATIAAGSRTIRIPGVHHGGSAILAHGINHSDHSATYDTPTAAELATLAAVYPAGGRQAAAAPAGTAFAVDGVSVNTTNLPAEADFTVDITLSSGQTIPSTMTVQWAADFGASNSTIKPSWISGPARAVFLADDQTVLDIPYGALLQAQLDIAVSTV